MTNPNGIRRNVQFGIGIEIDAVNVRTFIIPTPRKVCVGWKHRRKDKTKRSQVRNDHDDDFHRSRWILAVRNQIAKTKMMRTKTSRRENLYSLFLMSSVSESAAVSWYLHNICDQCLSRHCTSQHNLLPSSDMGHCHWEQVFGIDVRVSWDWGWVRGDTIHEYVKPLLCKIDIKNNQASSVETISQKNSK